MSILDDCEIFSDSSLSAFEANVMHVLRNDLGMPPAETSSYVDEMVHCFRAQGRGAFKTINHALRQSGIQLQWNNTLRHERTKKLVEWLQPHVKGNVLDYLCGYGSIGEVLADQVRCDVVLTERIEDYSVNRENHLIPFISFKDLPRMPPRSFGTVLLVTVLHHEAEPDEAMSHAFSLARERVIIVENCISSSHSERFHMLMDLFFNCCLNNIYIDCPMNHRYSEGWLELARQYGGKLAAHHSKPHIPGIPLSHDLFVFDVQC
jgi:hypothetical protein